MPLNTAEYYDTRGRYSKWIKIPPMNQSRFGVGCCIMDSNVYAVGGSDGTNLKTVERYDPDTNTWKLLAPMVTARYAITNFSLVFSCFLFLFYFDQSIQPDVTRDDFDWFGGRFHETLKYHFYAMYSNFHRSLFAGLFPVSLPYS